MIMHRNMQFEKNMYVYGLLHGKCIQPPSAVCSTCVFSMWLACLYMYLEAWKKTCSRALLVSTSGHACVCVIHALNSGHHAYVSQEELVKNTPRNAPVHSCRHVYIIYALYSDNHACISQEELVQNKHTSQCASPFMQAANERAALRRQLIHIHIFWGVLPPRQTTVFCVGECVWLCTCAGRSCVYVCAWVVHVDELYVCIYVCIYIHTCMTVNAMYACMHLGKFLQCRPRWIAYIHAHFPTCTSICLWRWGIHAFRAWICIGIMLAIVTVHIHSNFLVQGAQQFLNCKCNVCQCTWNHLSTAASTVAYDHRIAVMQK